MIKDYYFWIIVVMNLHNSPEARLIPHRAPQKDPSSSIAHVDANAKHAMRRGDKQAGGKKTALMKGQASA